jgi:uncharacterized protein YjbK
MAFHARGAVHPLHAVEVEIKLILENETEARALAAVLQDVGPPTRQENLYFEDPQHRFAAEGWAVRLRRTRNDGLLTIKGPAPQTSGTAFVTRGEWERPLAAGEWERLGTGGASLGSAVAQLLESAGATPLPPQLDPASLQPLGALTNVRVTARLPGPGAPLWAELDETHYPDGTVGRELELEVDPVAGPKAQQDAQQRLREVFGLARVPWRPSTITKLARLQAALERLGGPAPRLSPRGPSPPGSPRR